MGDFRPLNFSSLFLSGSALHSSLSVRSSLMGYTGIIRLPPPHTSVCLPLTMEGTLDLNLKCNHKSFLSTSFRCVRYWLSVSQYNESVCVQRLCRDWKSATPLLLTFLLYAKLCEGIRLRIVFLSSSHVFEWHHNGVTPPSSQSKSNQASLLS